MHNPSAADSFTYPEVGATAGEFPAGYHHFRLRRRIGAGRELFESTADRILAYGMQRGTGIFERADTPVARPGTSLTVRLGFGPLGITAPCRVVYVLDEPDRRGFAYGTLAGHPEIGEEQFAVEYDPADGSVYGVVAAFSRPAVWYIRLAGPLVTVVQRLIGARYIHAIRPR